MTVYTYWGNLNEKTDGTSVLKIASGFVDVGQSGDFTPQEYAYLSQKYLLRSGAIPWLRHDFPWQREDVFGQVLGGGGGSPTVPGAPTSVTATGGDSSASLTWTAPSNGGAAITGYRVTPYIGGTAQTPINTGSSAANYNVTGLTNGTAYTFKVAAINSVGTGSDSSASSSVTPAPAGVVQSHLFADSVLSSLAYGSDSSVVTVGSVFYIGPSGASVTRRALGVRFSLDSDVVTTNYSGATEGSGQIVGLLWGGGSANPASMTLLAHKEWSGYSGLHSSDTGLWNNILFDTPVNLQVTGAGGNPNYYVAGLFLAIGRYSIVSAIFPTTTGQTRNSPTDSHLFGLNTVDDSGVGNGVFVETGGAQTYSTPIDSGSATGVWYGIDVIVDNGP